MRKLAAVLAMGAVFACGTSAWAALAAPGPLPGYKGFEVSVANNSNSYLMYFGGGPTQGMNAEWVGPTGATSKTGLTTITTTDPSYSGSVGLYDTGGGGSGVNDYILLVSVAGDFADNFSINLGWKDKNNTLQNHTYTSSHFIYGPQTTKPGSNGTLGLYPGQNINDPATASYLMFIDLQAGGMGLSNNVPVNYSFTGLYDDVVAFNIYGYSPTGGNVSAGNAGIGWTNNTATNGYVIHGNAVAPVPIPPAFFLFGSGLSGMFFFKRRKFAA